LTAGRGVRAAVGGGKLAHGCHRTANPAIWVAASGKSAGITRCAAGSVREDGKLPQTNTANAAKHFVSEQERAEKGMANLT